MKINEIQTSVKALHYFSGHLTFYIINIPEPIFLSFYY